MKKQVNMWLDEEIHAILIKKAAESQLDTGKIVKVSTIAAELISKVLTNGNSSPSQDTSVDDKQDNEQDTKQAPANNPSAFNFDDLEI